MRKLMLLAAMALALPAAAHAQDPPRPMGGRGMMMMNTVDWMLKSKDELAPSADQIAKLEVIAKKLDTDTEKERAELEKAREEMRAGTADRSAMMIKVRPIREEMQKKDEAAVEEALKVLSADQQKTVKALLEARREEMQNRRRPNGQQPIG
jgi:Spy/CpxP family protein refolding chaperone